MTETDQIGGSSGWELQKENIQPLTGGRKMAFLQSSFDTTKTMADYEHQLEDKIRELEKKIDEEVNSADPLQSWIDLFQLMANSRLSVQLKARLTEKLKKCVRMYWSDERYKNNRRFIEVFVKYSLSGDMEMNLSKRIKYIDLALTHGIGKTVSLIYVSQAEAQEAFGSDADAVATLRKGIELGAEPVDQIQDALRQLEHRVAKRLAEKMLDSGSHEQRNFGSGVPVVGPSYQVSCFRSDLAPANPIRSGFPNPSGVKTKKGNKPVDVFKAPTPNAPVKQVRLEEIQPIFDETENLQSENVMNPSTWNKPGVVLEEEAEAVIPPPRVRFQVYAEASEIAPNSSAKKGILSDRSEVSESSDKKDVRSRSTSDTDGQRPNSVFKPTMKCARRFQDPEKKTDSFEHHGRKLYLRRRNFEEKAHQLLEVNCKLQTALGKALQEKSDLIAQIRRLEGEREKLRLDATRDRERRIALEEEIRGLKEVLAEKIRLAEERERERSTSNSGPSSSAEVTFVPQVAVGLYNKTCYKSTAMDLTKAADDDTDFLPPLPPISRIGANKKFLLYESHTESTPNVSAAGRSNPFKIQSSEPDLNIGDLTENIPPPVQGTPLLSELQALQNADDDCMVEVEDQETSIEVDMIQLGFDDADLTRALLSRPKPLLNSTLQIPEPEPSTRFNYLNQGNFINTQRFLPPTFGPQQGPLSPEAEARVSRFRSWNDTFNVDATVENNQVCLSPIQETSKETPSSCTTGSSSGNCTSTRGATMSGVSLDNNTRSGTGSTLGQPSQHHRL